MVASLSFILEVVGSNVHTNNVFLFLLYDKDVDRMTLNEGW